MTRRVRDSGAAVFRSRTTALKPLESASLQVEGQTPETYPSGL